MESAESRERNNLGAVPDRFDLSSVRSFFVQVEVSSVIVVVADVLSHESFQVMFIFGYRAVGKIVAHAAPSNLTKELKATSTRQTKHHQTLPDNT